MFAKPDVPPLPTFGGLSLQPEVPHHQTVCWKLVENVYNVICLCYLPNLGSASLECAGFQSHFGTEPQLSWRVCEGIGEPGHSGYPNANVSGSSPCRGGTFSLHGRTCSYHAPGRTSSYCGTRYHGTCYHGISTFSPGGVRARLARADCRPDSTSPTC